MARRYFKEKIRTIFDAGRRCRFYRDGGGRLLFLGGTVAAVCLAGSCATYHPRPLTEEAVQDRLRPPKTEQLCILANEIVHPLLQPVKIKPHEGLSPDGAAVLAVLLNPSLRVARDQKALSDAQLLQAGLLPDPDLSYSLDVPSGGDTTGKVTAYGLGLSWDVTSLIRRSSRRDQAQAHGDAVVLNIAWQEWQVAQAAKAAVYRLVTLQHQTALAETKQKISVQYLQEVKKAVTDGSLTAAALYAALGEILRAGEKRLELKQQADHQELQLKRLMGLPPDARIQLRNDIDLPARIEPPDVALLSEDLAQRRLDLLALRRGYESQEAAVRGAIRDQFPRIIIGPTLDRDTDDQRTTGFELTITLPIFNRNRGKIAEERATRQALFDEYADRIFTARSDTALLLSGIQYLNARIAESRAAESELGRLAENYRLALADGRSDAATCNKIENDLIDARMQTVALKGQLAQALVALELATGLYEIPEADPSPEPSVTEPVKETRQ